MKSTAMKSITLAGALMAAVLGGAEGRAESARATMGPVLNAHTLASADSLLKYCTRTAPKESATVAKQVKVLEGVAPATTIAQIRKSGEYKVAYESATGFLDKVDNRNAKLVCSRPLPKGPSG